MANDTCPHCGAARPRVYDTGTQWACLSWQMNDGSEIQSKDCRIREVKLLRKQMATVTSERDELRCRIDEAPVWWFNPTDLGEPIAMIWEAAGSPAIRVRLVRDDQPEEAVT